MVLKRGWRSQDPAELFKSIKLVFEKISTAIGYRVKSVSVRNLNKNY